MTTAELLDTLDEAARYVRSAPDEAARLANKATDEINARHKDAIYARDELTAATCRRIVDNIAVGRSMLACDPDVFRGYLLGAKFELLSGQI